MYISVIDPAHAWNLKVKNKSSKSNHQRLKDRCMDVDENNNGEASKSWVLKLHNGNTIL